MKYIIFKIKNGLWRLEWEDGSYSEHSTKDGAVKMVLQLSDKEASQLDHDMWAGRGKM